MTPVNLLQYLQKLSIGLKMALCQRPSFSLSLGCSDLLSKFSLWNNLVLLAEIKLGTLLVLKDSYQCRLQTAGLIGIKN